MFYSALCIVKKTVKTHYSLYLVVKVKIPVKAGIFDTFLIEKPQSVKT